MRIVVLGVAIWLGLRSAAAACDYPSPEPFEIVADDGDQEAPPAPRVRVGRVKRGKEPTRDGCSWQVSSCDDIGFVRIDLAEEEAAASERGYVLELRGKHPPGLDGFTERPLRPFEIGELVLAWSDGEGHAHYDFDIDVWSVDRAGNMSASPTTLHVQSAGSDGCAARSGRAGNALLPLLLALWLWRVRRRAGVRAGEVRG